jgi:thioredoxin-related protein
MIKLISILSLLTVLSFANHIHWLGNYDKALKKAHNEKKPLMVLLVKNRCDSCNNIFKNIFMNQKYIKQLNENFISVIVTYEQKLNYPIEMFYSTTFPTLFFVSNKDESFLTEPIYGNKITQKIIKRVLKNYE